MRTLIVGSGVIGLCTAYWLARAGQEVIVLERRDGPGLETSFANGALLTPSMPEPWNAPGCGRTLIRSLISSTSPLELRLSQVPDLLGWGTSFIRNASPPRFARHVVANLRLALYSKQCLKELSAQTGLAYEFRECGSLRLFRNPEALERASRAARGLEPEGLRHRVITAREVVDIEPALTNLVSKLSGALYYELDATADAHLFCVKLAEVLAERGVTLRFGTHVERFEEVRGKITIALTNTGGLSADQYVVAAGSYSRALCRAAGVDLPIRPVKGYSLTIPRGSGVPRLSTAVVDDDLHAAIVPYQGGIRVAGTAEFAGYDLTPRPARIRNLQWLVGQVFPRVAYDERSAMAWCGLRSMSADGVPVIGRTAKQNLWINTGHGHLGWTMAAGSASLLADMMFRRTPALDARVYQVSRSV